MAGLAAALAILVGSIGKVARDISLMTQDQIAEAFEPRTPGRGGSSAMPHKRNPTGCQVALSAAIRAPGLAAAILSGLPQEHERGLGGWRAEADPRHAVRTGARRARSQTRHRGPAGRRRRHAPEPERR